MDTPTYDAPPEPDYTPRANPIIDAPATHAACARDYENAAASAPPSTSRTGAPDDRHLPEGVIARYLTVGAPPSTSPTSTTC
ncbi:hypothetical protein [Streptomyces filamentosus]|uniref:hypothetical protein n=1 Tax=Streptomyces filamentosus TaxID=67294 RepID=UPI00123C0C0C|nr:hypothetical protein [Streptomyces filamentosus]